MRKTTMTLPETEISPLRWGWLERLAGHFCAAYAGDEGDEGGDDGGDEGGDPAVEDEDMAFGGDDDDDDQGDEGGDDDAGDDDALEDDDSALFDDEDEDDEADADDDSDDDDASDDDDDEIDDDDLDEEAAQAEHNERVEALSELWDTRLEKAAAAGEGASLRPNVKLGDVKLRADGLAKFKEILSKEGADADIQAEAIFEVAMDAAIQTITAYDAQHVQTHLGEMSKAQQKRELDRRYEEFSETPEGVVMNADPALKKKMQEVWNEKVEKAGGSTELAMRISYKDYFRLAGGRVTKKALREAKAGKSSKKAAKKPARSKTKAIAAGRSPRARQATGIAKPRVKKSDERESAEHIAASSEPFFSVS